MIDINDLKEDSSSGANLIDLMQRMLEMVAEPPGKIEKKDIYPKEFLRQDVFDYLDRHDIIFADGSFDYMLAIDPYGRLVKVRVIVLPPMRGSALRLR